MEQSTVPAKVACKPRATPLDRYGDPQTAIDTLVSLSDMALLAGVRLCTVHDAYMLGSLPDPDHEGNQETDGHSGRGALNRFNSLWRWSRVLEWLCRRFKRDDLPERLTPAWEWVLSPAFLARRGP